MYYVTENDTYIGKFKTVEEVNHFVASKGYTIIDIHYYNTVEIIVEVERW